ncbi:heme peroxidase [Crassisporium funariophilum]|nr:heme peroxidase [Crassisporium funariophilum]
MGIPWSLQLYLAVILISPATGYKWPSPQYDALEALLYEGRRLDGSNFASIQHPCKTRGGSRSSIGAEWLRLAYHDTATHDAQEGTGGLDASIAFELGREENKGSGMLQSLQDFESFSNKYVSRSDVIAMGSVFAVASCGGPIIPFRGGRVDALAAGPLGVPEAHQDLSTHIALFARQGFTQAEMITLVACGHTLGGVRSSDFPDIVPAGSDPTIPNFEDFDTTHQFDPNVVTQYLDGSTTNPLVVDRNSTLNSDRRIFSSDNNVTMQSLASAESFAQSCSAVLERMLNMVPSTVKLTEPIDLLPAKVSNAQLTIERGKLVFKASFRLAERIGTTVGKTRVVKLLWCDRHGEFQNCNGNAKSAPFASQSKDDPQISPLTFKLGYYFVRYEFVIPIDPTISIAQFWFEVDERDGKPAKLYDNDSTGYLVAQDELLYVPTLSSVNFHGVNDSIKTYDIVAAARKGINPARIYLDAYDNAMEKYAPPLSMSAELKFNQSIPEVEGFQFYSAVVEDVGTQLTIDLHGVVNGTTITEDFLQTYFLDTSIPYTPPTKVETTIRSPPSPTPSTSFSLGLLDYMDNFHSVSLLVVGFMAIITM